MSDFTLTDGRVFSEDEVMRMVTGFDDCYAVCPVCDHEQWVEPDANYECSNCKEGRLVSPLIELGIM